jgi:AraC-like DNA-binding protein
MLKPAVTVPIFAVHGLLGGARAKGLATSAWLDLVLGQAGIPPSLLGQAFSRVTMGQYLALFTAVKDSLDDECLAYLPGRPMRCGSFALMARAALGARSLADAAHRLGRAFVLLQDDVGLVLVEDGPLRGVALAARDGGRLHGNFLHELLLRVFWRLLVWLHGRPLASRRFDFAFEQPAYAANYGQIFSGVLRFAASRSAVWFDADAFTHPVRRDVEALKIFLRGAPANVVGPHLVERATSARVRALLQQADAGWPDLVTVAHHLHMSISTLQRHLAVEDTSFQALKDQLRRDMAIVRLTASEVTLAALAALAADLGFTDATAFQRAFKSWTGIAPGTYRAGARGGPRAG